MRKRAKSPKPNHYQSALLRRIAQSALMKTYIEGEARYSLQSGATIPTPTAQVLIRNRWVVPQRDGLGLFEESQTYVALKP